LYPLSSFLFPFPSLLGGRSTCAITVINAGLLEATYTSNDTFIVEWEGVGPVEAFTCTLRESGLSAEAEPIS